MRWPRLLFASLLAFSLTRFAAADPARTTAPSTAPVAGCTAKVKSAKVAVVALKSHDPDPPPSGEDSKLFIGLRNEQSPRGGDRRTDQKLLIVEVEVTNVGREKCVYHSLAGLDEKCPTMVVLHDDVRTVYAVASFGDMDVVGAVKGAKTLKPGEALTDVLVFEVPPRNVKGLRLIVPRENVGRKDRVQPLPVTPER